MSGPSVRHQNHVLALSFGQVAHIQSTQAVLLFTCTSLDVQLLTASGRLHACNDRTAELNASQLTVNPVGRVQSTDRGRPERPSSSELHGGFVAWTA
jgi:hypothetical protein